MKKNGRRIIPENYYVGIESGKRMTVSSCKRILRYGEEKIILELSGCYLTVCGKELSMSGFFGEELSLSGRISSLTFDKSFPEVPSRD